MNYYSFDQSINEKVQKSAVQTSSGAPSAGQIPALNAAGQIDSSMLPSGSSQIVFGTSKPGVEDGSVLWVNQNPGYEGLYYFDTARNSWLDTAFITLHTGEDGADNTNLGFAGMNFASNYAGYNINQNMTIVSIFASCRDINNNSKELRIRERLAENNFFSTTKIELENRDVSFVRLSKGNILVGRLSMKVKTRG